MDAKKRNGIVLFSALALLVIAIVAVLGLRLQKSPQETAETSGNNVLSGTFTGTAAGFGGDVTVRLEVEHGEILSCSITGEAETPDVGGKYLSRFESQVVEKQGQVDAVAGATMTSNAVKTALQQAMTSAGLIISTDNSMAPGTYVGRAHGFSCIDYVTVSVTVTDKEIKDIQLLDTFQDDMDSYENRYMCQGAFESLGPQITEYQSIGVDAVTGATGSSNGIKNAVRNALEQAFQADGLSEAEASNAVNAMFTSNKPEKKTDTVRLEYDVVVVGAGAAGSVASLTALEQDVSVLNIEKTFRWGGQSMLTGGPKVYNANTTEAEAQAVLEDYEQVIVSSRFGDDTKWNDSEYREAHADEYTPVNAEAYKAVIPASGKGARTLMENGIHFVPSTVDYSAMIGGGMPDMVNGMPDMADGMPDTADGMPDMAGGMPDMTGGMPDMDGMAAMMAVRDADALSPEDADDFSSTGSGTTLSYSVAEKYYDVVFENYVRKGGDYLLRTTAKELIYSDDSKSEIVGVRAYGDDGTTYEVYAKAIVLATGGYGGNEELMDQWAVGGENWIYYGWQGNDGDGILMALDAGANPYNLEAYPMSHQRMGFQFTTQFETQTTEEGRVWSPNDLTVVLACNDDGVHITENGESFRTDDIGILSGFAGSMGTYYLGSSYYVVYSEDQLEEYRQNGLKNTSMGFQNVGEGIPKNYPLGDWVDTVLGEAESQGWAWKVSSLEEGDAVLGMEKGTLAAAYAADGTSLNHAQDAGYVIIRCCGLAISSCGGVEVNADMQAVRSDGTAIENLFIAGNDGFGNIMATGAEYSIGGDAGMFVLGSGSIAGERAAALAVSKK